MLKGFSDRVLVFIGFVLLLLLIIFCYLVGPTCFDLFLYKLSFYNFLVWWFFLFWNNPRFLIWWFFSLVVRFLFSFNLAFYVPVNIMLPFALIFDSRSETWFRCFEVFYVIIFVITFVFCFSCIIGFLPFLS